MMTAYAVVIGLLISTHSTPKGDWIVAWKDASGALVVADVCDEQTTEQANASVCRERAAEFNAEDEECGGVATGYFAMWRAE